VNFCNVKKNVHGKMNFIFDFHLYFHSESAAYVLFVFEAERDFKRPLDGFFIFIYLSKTIGFVGIR
jgi:hypothetical protein